MPSVLAMILAGGEGRRLDPLTLHRAVAGGAVRFTRIVDFVLSNFVNSRIYDIALLTQTKAESLIDHIEKSWSSMMGALVGGITINPAQQRLHKDWYPGTADAVYQNFNRIAKVNPELVAVFGGDHIYKMNLREVIAFHQERGADMTVAAIFGADGKGRRPVRRARGGRALEHDRLRGKAGEAQGDSREPQLLHGSDGQLPVRPRPAYLLLCRGRAEEDGEQGRAQADAGP